MTSPARELTGPQIELLRFLAGRQDVPASLRSSMYTALSSRGLIEKDHRRAYQVTALGLELLAKLQP
jgi:Mn-dependent DtxR family transcriptional regulator